MDTLSKRSLSGLVFYVAGLGALLFLPAWTVAFWQAWVYWVIVSAALLLITVYFLRKDPALVERRLRAGPGGEKEKSQRVIQSLATVALLGLLIIPGLDHHFGWSRVPTALVAAGDLMVVAGFWVIFLVFRENTYTSGVVEVADDQTVISTGPYSIVRHPMYAGALLLFFGTPLALGSWWALTAAVAMAAALISRLLHEERFLRHNLSGYQAYCTQVGRHLIPGVW